MPTSHCHSLHIIHGLTIGGAELDLLRKCRHLVEQMGDSLTICCLMRRGELAEAAEEAGIRVIGPLMRGRYDVAVIWRLRALLLNPSVDLVHSHLFAANLITWFALLTLPPSARPHWLAAEHAMPERWPRSVLLADKAIAQMADHFLVPSRNAADAYAAQGLPADTLRVFRNGLDAAQFDSAERASRRATMRAALGIPADRFVIGTICRLEPVKDLPLLFAAVAGLDVVLLVVGDGTQRAALTRLVHEHGQEDQIQLLGRRDDIADLLAAFDLFVLSSSSESFGLAVAEALLMETPVVATAVGGVPELTGDGRFAALVPPGDPVALRAAIQRAVQQPDLLRARVAQGRAFVADFYAAAAVADELHRLYCEVTA